jgi:CRISPR-associated protein Cmr2
MSYDLYVAMGGVSQQDVKAIVDGEHQRVRIADIAARIRLLAGVAAQNESVKDYVVGGDRRRGGGYKSLVHAKEPKESYYAKELIAKERARLNALDLLKPTAPDLQCLPLGSWFLQFTLTLAKPWMSKDDAPFYVAESVNPVRKDKVFKVPLVAAASWKGLLRWTAMQVRLFERKRELTPDAFADERLAQTLLFGDEKGEEPGKTKDFAAYLDDLGEKEARRLYVQKVREYFRLDEKDEMPHHSGRLMFYPTFFDLIDVEVINPHSRKTKAGTYPIYLECVPSGAQGTFSLLYVPFDLIGQPNEEIIEQAKANLQIIAEAIGAMMLTYGFSAKRSSGYGTAEDNITSFVRARVDDTRVDEKPFTRLNGLAEEVKNVAW